MSRIAVLMLLSIAITWGKVKVVTSTSDLAAITREVGGNLVKVESIARGSQDPHYIEVLPSHMLKVKRADIYLKVGMELDLWADKIIGGSRNKDLVIVDCSENINAQEVPAGKIDASMGDIHRFGNPHYWLDPLNGQVIAESIVRALSLKDPENVAKYEDNLRTFIETIRKYQESWSVKYADLKDVELIYYHNTWPYFNNRFGLQVLDFVEPKPGIMPTPNHVDHLVKLIQNKQLKVLAMEPYFSDKAPNYLVQKTDIKVVKLAPSVGAQEGTDTYLEMIQYNLDALQSALGDD